MFLKEKNQPWEDPVGDNIRESIDNAISKVMSKASELEGKWSSSLLSDFDFKQACNKTENFTL